MAEGFQGGGRRGFMPSYTRSLPTEPSQGWPKHMGPYFLKWKPWQNSNPSWDWNPNLSQTLVDQERGLHSRSVLPLLSSRPSHLLGWTPCSIGRMGTLMLIYINCKILLRSKSTWK